MTSSSYQRRGQQAAIQWTCDVCTYPIEDSRGAVWLSWEDLNRSLPDRRQPRVRTAIDVMSAPDGPRWRITHDSCVHPTDLEGGYWIAVEELRTDRDLLSWTAHLMEKNWLYETNWDQVLRVVAHTDRQEI